MRFIRHRRALNEGDSTRKASVKASGCVCRALDPSSDHREKSLHLRSTSAKSANYAQAYISGNALIILDSPRSLLQTIYLEDERELETVQVDDESGRIATCARSTGYIYKPYGQDEGALKVGRHFLESLG